MRPLRHLAGPIDDARASWDQYVAELAQREADLNALEGRADWLLADAYLDDATAADLQKVKSDIAGARSRVFGVIDAVRKVGDWWNKPAADTAWARDVGMAGLGGLGLVWLAPIPLAALAAAIALLVGVLKHADPIVTRAEQIRQTTAQLVEQGMPVEQAAATARASVPTGGASIGDGIGQIGMWAAIAAVVFLLMK